MKLYREPSPGAPMTHENTIPVFIIDDLEELEGPASGVVTLPIELDWSPAPTYDLDQPRRVLTMYATVLREAHSEEELARYLNADILRAVWGELRLPSFVRASWESAHPELMKRSAKI